MTLLRRLRVLRQRLRSSWRKEAMDAELLKEFAFHLDQLVHENIAEGMPSGEARSAARRTLGNAGLLEEECRDQRASRGCTICGWTCATAPACCAGIRDSASSRSPLWLWASGLSRVQLKFP